MTARSRSALAAIAAVLLLAACGDDGGGSAAPPTTLAATAPDTPPFETATLTEDLVDRSRGRDLPTYIWYPEDVDGPVPLIVLAHGYTGHPDLYDEQLGPSWAAAGYVVAAPTFPLTNRDAPGGAVLGDYLEQPADVSFVLDEVLALAHDPASPLAGLIDADHVGLVGHSLGGVTAFAVGFNSCCLDDRFDAVMVFAAVPGSFDGEYVDSGTPLLMMLGENDDAVAYPAGVAAYEAAAPPKYLVTILGGTHSPPFEDAGSFADAVVDDVSILFWDVYLRGEDAHDALVAGAGISGFTTFEYELT